MMVEFRARRLTGRRRYGFSLVELVIVIVIIGIIAAIAVPRVSSGASGAGEGVLRGDLKVLRNAIDNYAAEHNQVFPGVNDDGAGGAAGSAEAFISQLTKFSDDAGKTSTAPDATCKFGPYLRRIPPAPVGKHKNNSDVVIDASNSPPLVASTAAGWVYNPETGEIIVNTDEANKDGSHTFDEY